MLRRLYRKLCKLHESFSLTNFAYYEIAAYSDTFALDPALGLAFVFPACAGWSQSQKHTYSGSCRVDDYLSGAEAFQSRRQEP